MSKRYKAKVVILQRDDMADEFIEALDHIYSEHGEKEASKVLEILTPAMTRLYDFENPRAMEERAIHVKSDTKEGLKAAVKQAEKDLIKQAKKESKRIDEDRGNFFDILKKMSEGEAGSMKAFAHTMIDEMIRDGVKKGELSAEAGKYWEEFKKENLSSEGEVKH